VSRLRLLLGISLVSAFVFVNLLASFLDKDKTAISDAHLETPYGKIYLEK